MRKKTCYEITLATATARHIFRTTSKRLAAAKYKQFAAMGFGQNHAIGGKTFYIFVESKRRKLVR